MSVLDKNGAIEKAKAKSQNAQSNSIFIDIEDCRWSNFKKLAPQAMLKRVVDDSFPFIKDINAKDEPYTRYMKNAAFMISNAALLDEAVNSIYTTIKNSRLQGNNFKILRETFMSI